MWTPIRTYLATIHNTYRSVRSAHEGIRLVVDIFLNQQHPPPDNERESTFAALCSRILGDCLNDLKNRSRNADVDVPGITGISYHLLVKRCISLAKNTSVPPDLRADQLTLLYDFANGSNLEDGALIRAMVSNQTITVLSETLQLIADDPTFPHEPEPPMRGMGSSTLEDRMQILWFTIMEYAQRFSLEDAMTQAVSSNMFSHTEVWSLTAPATYACKFL